MANPVLTRQFGEPAASDAALQTAPAPPVTVGESRMTIGSVAAATFFLLLLVVGGAVYGWANAVAVQRWYWLFVVVLLVLVFATVARPALAPITGIVAPGPWPPATRPPCGNSPRRRRSTAGP